MCFPIDKYLEKVYNLSANKGVVIVVVKERSPAYDIGLQPGDVLVSINKIKINNMNRFRTVASNFKISDPIQMEILRGNEILALETKIGQVPEVSEKLPKTTSETSDYTDFRKITQIVSSDI